MSIPDPQPDPLAALAIRLATAGLTIGEKNIAVDEPTAGVAPAAADEVSALMAAQFALQAQLYQAASARMCQAMGAQAAAIQLLAALNNSAGTGATSDDGDAAVTF